MIDPWSNVDECMPVGPRVLLVSDGTTTGIGFHRHFSTFLSGDYWQWVIIWPRPDDDTPFNVTRWTELPK